MPACTLATRALSSYLPNHLFVFSPLVLAVHVCVCE
jgi:hypothetical protein